MQLERTGFVTRLPVSRSTGNPICIFAALYSQDTLRIMFCPKNYLEAVMITISSSEYQIPEFKKIILCVILLVCKEINVFEMNSNPLIKKTV